MIIINTSKSLKITSFSTVISFIIQTATTIILARIFSPKEFGAIAAVAIITSYADIFWQMGLGPSIVQKKKLSQSDIQTAHLSSLLLGLLTLIVLNIFSKEFSALVGLKQPYLLSVMSISFIINSFGVIPNSLLQRNLKFSLIAFKDVLGNTIYLFSALLLGLRGYGIWSLVLATNLRYMTTAFLPYFFVKKDIAKGFSLFSLNKIKDMMSFGIGYSISRILNVTTNQIDYIVVSKNLGEATLGIYSRAFQLMSVPANLVGQVVDLVYFPVMSKIQEDDMELNKIYINYTSFMSLIYFPISALLYVYSSEFVAIFLGNRWSLVSLPLKILGLSLFFRVGYKITDPLFRAKGAVYERAAIHFIQAVLTALLSYIGAKLFGIVGVSIGVTLSLIINYVLIAFRVSKLIGKRSNKLYKSIFLGMTINYLSIPIMSILKGYVYILSGKILGLIISIIISFIIVCFINYLCIKLIYDKHSMEFLINKIKKRI